VARLIVRQSIVPRAASWSPSAVRGGHVAFVLQWLVGLERLGHDVLFVNTVSSLAPAEQRQVASAFASVLGTWWPLERSVLYDTSARRALAGCSSAAFERFAVDADALLTLAAAAEPVPPPPLDRVRRRVFVDTDPGYIHLWIEMHGLDAIVGAHDVYFTVGANVGTPRSRLPTGGVDWRHTWNPVVLDWWPQGQPLVRDRFTTIADWWGQPYVEFDGRIFGPKREEFLAFIDVPGIVHEPIELALDIPPDDADLPVLARAGWRVTTPAAVESVEDYRTWIAGSYGEFSCVKGVYAGTRCGWFSDRSAAYLACGRPVIVQETGLSDVLPTGLGLFAFRTVDEAVEAVRTVRRDYARHSHAARQLAADHFDSSRVLSALLVQAGVCPA
jgi:hypothetical protein